MAYNPQNPNGQATSANSSPVVIASDQSTLPVSGTVTATVSGTVAATQSGSWLLSANSGVDIGDVTINNGSGVSAVNIQDGGNSITVDGTFWQAIQPVSGTVTANIGTTNGLALDATLTGGTARTKITDGTSNASVKAASTAAVATDPALVVAISPNNSVAVTGTFWQATQPVSGTVTVTQATAANLNATVIGTITANAGTNLNTSALALETGGNLATVKTNTDNLALLQASTTSGQKGNLIFGAVTTAAPSYTTAQSNPLSLTTSGLLRVDNSGVTQPISGTVTANAGTGTMNVSVQNASIPVTGTFWQATQPVSGTVTVTQSTAANLNATVTGTVAATQSGTWNINNISGTVSLPTGAATSANQTTLGSQTTKINDGTNTAAVKAASTAAIATDPALVVAVSPNNTINVASHNVTNAGTFAVQATQAGTWNVGLNAGTNAIGSITNTSFAATQATASSLLNKPYGSVTTAAPTYTTGTDNALSLTTAGALRVDGSGATQPVSGTVTVSQATAANLNATVTGTVAATQSGTWTVQPGNTANTTAWLVTGTGGTFPVTGSITANIGTSGSLALDATLTGGTQKAIVRGGAKGTTTAADVTSTASGANRQPLDVAIYDAAGNQITSFGGGTQYLDGAARGTATGTLMMVDDGTLIQAASGTSGGLLKVDISGTAANATAIKVDGSAVTQPISGSVTVSQATAANLNATVTGTVAATQSGTWNITNISGTVSLPTGAATSANQTTLGSQTTKINDGTNTAAVKAASTAAIATDQALVVAVSPNNTINVATHAVTQSGTWTVQPGNTANTTAWLVTGTGGTFPVTGTVTANIGTSGSLALDATLTGGTQKAILRSGAKGTTVAADVTSTASGVNRQPLDVAIYDAAGNQITSFGGGTQYLDGTAVATPTGTLMMIDDGTNVRSAVGTTGGVLKVDLSATSSNNSSFPIRVENQDFLYTSFITTSSVTSNIVYGASTCLFVIYGSPSWTGTINLQRSNDNSNYYLVNDSVSIFSLNTNSYITGGNITQSGTYLINFSGWSYLRFVPTGVTGTAGISARFSPAAYPLPTTRLISSESSIASGSLTSATSSSSFTLTPDSSTVYLTITTTGWVAQVFGEISSDGTNWIRITSDTEVYRVNDGTPMAGGLISVFTSNAIYAINVAGASFFRVTVGSYTSGTITYSIKSGTGVSIVKQTPFETSNQFVGTFRGTVTSASLNTVFTGGLPLYRRLAVTYISLSVVTAAAAGQEFLIFFGAGQQALTTRLSTNLFGATNFTSDQLIWRGALTATTSSTPGIIINLTTPIISSSSLNTGTGALQNSLPNIYIQNQGTASITIACTIYGYKL